MPDQHPTLRAWELGRQLQEQAKRAGLTGIELAQAAGYTTSKVSRFFTGLRPPNPMEVVLVLGLCGVYHGPVHDELMALARESRREGWLQPYRGHEPFMQRTLLALESAADEIVCYDTTRVPTLLQTREYARATFDASPTIPYGEADERVQLHAERCKVLNDQYPPRCTFLIDEYALTRTGPDKDVMREQLHHLLRASVRPNISVRVVPDSAGFHAGKDIPFEHIDIADFRRVIHLEQHTTELFLDQLPIVRAYEEIMRGLIAVAHTEERTRQLITELAGGPLDDQPAE